MYKIGRVYRSKAGEAANLAKLVYAQAKIYRDSARVVHRLLQRIHPFRRPKDSNTRMAGR